MAETNCRNASNPPADAPTPTTAIGPTAGSVGLVRGRMDLVRSTVVAMPSPPGPLTRSLESEGDAFAGLLAEFLADFFGDFFREVTPSPTGCLDLRRPGDSASLEPAAFRLVFTAAPGGVGWHPTLSLNGAEPAFGRAPARLRTREVPIAKEPAAPAGGPPAGARPRRTMPRA